LKCYIKNMKKLVGNSRSRRNYSKFFNTKFGFLKISL